MNDGHIGKITGNKTRTEQALRASELSYRRLFEAAQDGILILDVNTGRITDVNPFLFNLLGFSHDEMVGKTVGELSPFKDIVSNQAMLERLQKDGYVRYEDLPLETRDGRHIAVEFVSNVYQAGDKKVIQCNIRDITERKRTEEALRESEELLKQSQHVARVGHYTLDAVSGDWKTSETLDNIFGIDATFKRNVAGWSQLLHPEDRDTMFAYLQEHVLKQHNPFDKEYRIVRANDGDIRWVHGTGQLRFSASGETLEMFGTIQDITERKQAEKERLPGERPFSKPRSTPPLTAF